MKSIFTRTYFVLILLMTLGFVGSLILVSDFSPDEGYSDFLINSKVEANLFYETFNDNNLHDLIAFADGYRAFYVTKLKLVDLEELNALNIQLPANISESAYISPKSDDGWLYIAASPEPNLYLLIEDGLDLDGISPKMIAAILFPFITMFSILGFAFWYISKYIAKPINALSNSLSKLGKGDLSARVKPNRTEPIKTLSHGFNDMASQIQELVNDYKVLLGAIPHELRTPIARTKFALGMSKTVKNQEEHYKYIESADGYLTELESVVDATLSFSKLYSEDAKEAQYFSFKRLILDEINAQDAQHIKVSLKCDIEGVDGSPNAIRLAISNILRNAIKYAKSKVEINVSIDKDGLVRCLISDDGQGIPDAERLNIFKPFYRLDSSRSRKTGNLGLGLAVVELVSRKINGSVSVEQSILGGATICFKWDGKSNKTN